MIRRLIFAAASGIGWLIDRATQKWIRALEAADDAMWDGGDDE